MKGQTLTFRIINRKWRIRVLSDKQYAKNKERKGSLAVTFVHKRRIDLSPMGTDRSTIIHELVHAYLSEMCIHSSELNVAELEEFFAELMSRRGRELLGLADILYRDVKILLTKLKKVRKL